MLGMASTEQDEVPLPQSRVRTLSQEDSASASEVSSQQGRPKRRKSLPWGTAPDELRTISSLVERFHYTPQSKSNVFVMVGLPARGKSFVSMRLTRFLQWTGAEARVFNVGKHRRESETGVQDAGYFDPTSATAVSRRDELAMQVCDSMLKWVLEKDGRFGVFDATNTTKARRSAVANRLGNTKDLGVVFVESLCDDDAVLEANIAQKLAKSPDYSSLEKAAAREDLLQRVSHYEKVYEPLQEETIVVQGKRKNIAYIKLVNFASHVVAHNIYGRTATLVLPYLMALHVGSRPVWLVRLPHSDQSARAWRSTNDGTWPPPPHIRFSEHSLSSKGCKFADALTKFVKQRSNDTAVFCCTHRRSTDVGDRLGGCRIRASLNPQDRGACNGLRAADIAEQQPEVFADPMTKRFPGGESLADMLLRLTPTLLEIEQEMRPTLIVAPLSVLQVIYCYYAQRPISDAMKIPLPIHTVFQMRPDGGDFIEQKLTEADF